MSTPEVDLSEFEGQSLQKTDDRDLIIEAERRGFIVTKDAPGERRVELTSKGTGHVRFGVASDTHLGHRKQQLTYLEDFCKQAGDFGVEFMLHAGDVVDGQNMHRDQQFELFKHGVDAQGQYAKEKLPVVQVKKRTVPWYIIGGNHDGSGYNDVGANVLRILAEREDVNFLGAPAATFHYDSLRIYLLHPDGGPSYARSYKLQKIVEQFAPDDKPHIMLAGHWHITAHVPGYRNVEAFALPCFQSQTAYLKRKGLAPVIGGLLFDAEYDASGLTNLTTKWVLYRTPLESDH